MKFKIEGVLIDRDEIHSDSYVKYDKRLRQLRTFYTILKPLVQKAQQNIESYHNFQRANSLDRVARNVTTNKIKILDPELVKFVDNKKREYVKDHEDIPENFLMLTIIYSASLFEFYINDVLELVSPNNSIRFRSEKLKRIKKKITSIPPELDKYDDNIEEIINIRNVLVHNEGLVDKQFLERVKDSNYSIGEKITLNESLMHEVINNLHNFMTILDREYKKQYFD